MAIPSLRLYFFSLAVLLAPPVSFSQTASQVVAGKEIFAESCAGCHGADTYGTDRAPGLSGNRRVRARTLEQLHNIVLHGIPAAGMPAFNFPSEKLDAIVAFVHSLNSAAFETPVPGNPEAGKQIFFGNSQQCGACHMVNGRGSDTGPDLSTVGREMTVEEIEGVLLHPDSHITPGYQLVTVHLRNGSSVEGFARGQTNFDVQLQDRSGQFHLLHSPEILSVAKEQHSLMKPWSDTPEELQDVVAYLSRLTGVTPADPKTAVDANTSSTSNIDFDRIEHPQPGDWLTYNGNLQSNRYSPLTQVNTGNIGQLALKWLFPIEHFGLETTPIVAGGVMYVTGPNQAYALDALSGRVIWKYARPRTQGLVGDASLGTNRGMAVLKDKVFMVTDNAHLLALNRVTGALVWENVMPKEPMKYGSTVSPLIVNNTVIAGVSGGDWGIRGFIVCYQADTGEELWRHWAIPNRGEPGSETWKGSDLLLGGGSTWLTGSFDPETNTLFWPTGNPWPDSDDRNRPGDNLFTNSILALNPSTGALKWYFQFTPHDTNDRDATEPPALVDAEYQGQPRKLLLHADRNGYFYVFDRTDGKLLLHSQFVRVMNWSTGIDDAGRPVLSPAFKASHNRRTGCPDDAANWGSTAFDPQTRLYYFESLEQCQSGTLNGSLRTSAHLDETGEKYVRAVNIDTGKVMWENPQPGHVLLKSWPGVLGTAGGLLFYSDPDGSFVAADAATGKPLWHFATNITMKASPMTFAIDGNQYVAIAAGSNILCFGLPSLPH
ncbi:MAG TPA: PQQ-binding-like beta-propeller repeat protein [Bryobacteraceae bacterium]|jgi:PQQ-dependent dehydrogenase (methanol/ethanol family)